MNHDLVIEAVAMAFATTHDAVHHALQANPDLSDIALLARHARLAETTLPPAAPTPPAAPANATILLD